MDKNKRLDSIQRIVRRDMEAWRPVLEECDAFQRIYDGDHSVTALVDGDPVRETTHVRNIAQELIETQIDINIPQPKVSTMTQDRERQAEIIESKIRNELDRLPMEVLNDRAERINRICGGMLYYLEWDSNQVTHDQAGQLRLSVLHPRNFVPQAGIYTGLQDMDHMTIKLPMTKKYVKERYGVDVSDVAEQEPDIRGTEAKPESDIVTVYIYLSRNDSRGISRFVYTDDVVLEDLEDYQAHIVKRCQKCGEVWTQNAVTIPAIRSDGTVDSSEQTPAQDGVCPYCGSRSLRDEVATAEQVFVPIAIPDGEIPGAERAMVQREGGMQEVLVPTEIPYYKPDAFPVVLIRNISADGKLLGESDVARIRDQQNTSNRISRKIIDLLLKAGSYMTKPNDGRIKLDAGDMKPWGIDNVSDVEKFRVISMQGDISQLMVWREAVYEEARQNLGITDSYQGRRDATATSGVAKQFSASQAEGRLESKLVQKNAGFADLFQLMFKFLLAYADEERPVVGRGDDGNPEYGTFRKYDFLRRDANGEWYYDADAFLFSVDDTSPLASNRSGMWQETVAYFQSGAFGDPTDLSTIVMFWQKMEDLHYPGAAATKSAMQKRLQEQQSAQQAAQHAQMQAQQAQMQAQQAAQEQENQRRNAELILRAAQADARTSASANIHLSSGKGGEDNGS